VCFPPYLTRDDSPLIKILSSKVAR
jgi:hypothetical protein